MADSTVQLNAGAGGDNLDAEALTVGATAVKRERVQIAGPGATEIAGVDATTKHVKAADFRDRAVVDANNSSTATMGSAGSFTGAATNVLPYDQITVNVAGAPEVCHGTLFFEFSPDGTNWDVSVPLAVSDLNVVIPFPLRVVLKWFRVRYVNGTTVQTAFRLTTLLHYDYPGPLMRSPAQVLGPEEPVQVVRALIEPGIGVGQRRILGADRSVFGEAIVMPRINQVQADFSQAIANNDVSSTITGTGGSTAQGSGEATMTTGPGVLATSARLQTNQAIRYTPGREIFALFTARFTTPSATAGEHQRIGLYDDNNGFFLGFQGNVFGFTVRSGAADTFTALTAANGDPLDGTFLSRFGRGNVLEAYDPTKKNVWRFRLGWLGSSVGHFEIQSPDGEWMTVHTLRFPNLQTAPSILSPNLPMRAEVIKGAADATNLTLGTGSWAAGTVQDPIGLEPYASKSRVEVQANATLTGIALVGVGVALFAVPTGRRFRLTDLLLSYDSNQNTAAEAQLRDATTFNGGSLVYRLNISGTGAHEVIAHAWKSPLGFTTQVELAFSATHAGSIITANISGYTEPL